MRKNEILQNFTLSQEKGHRPGMPLENNKKNGLDIKSVFQ